LAAARRESAAVAHASQLNLALAGLAQKLAAADCEIAALRLENAELRTSVDRNDPIAAGSAQLATAGP
jgi:hypothetical protein